MELKLYESELKVMEILWSGGNLPASQIAKTAHELYGWSTTTTYTVIQKCISKGAIERRNPKFTCCPLAMKNEIQAYETRELLQRHYDGKADRLIAALAENHSFTEEELTDLEQLIRRLKKKKEQVSL